MSDPSDTGDISDSSDTESVTEEFSKAEQTKAERDFDQEGTQRATIARMRREIHHLFADIGNLIPVMKNGEVPGHEKQCHHPRSNQSIRDKQMMPIHWKNMRSMKLGTPTRR